MVYALLGNNQARDPWLDESFATYAQARAAGQLDIYKHSDVDSDVRGKLGQPMTYWAGRGGFDRYVRGVYDQSAAALIEGQRRAGDDVFAQAMRAYIDTYAHQVVEPADVEKAFKSEKGKPPIEEEGSSDSAVIEGGETQLIDLDLKPGRYAFYCFITDRQGGPPHALKGMVDEFEIK